MTNVGAVYVELVPNDYLLAARATAFTCKAEVFPRPVGGTVRNEMGCGRHIGQQIGPDISLRLERPSWHSAIEDALLDFY